MIKKNIIPLIISIVLILISLVVISTSNTILSQKHYIGFLLVLLSLVIYFMKNELYIYVFSFFLLTGLIGLTDIYYLTIYVGIGILQINPIFLALFIVFVILNKDELNKLFPKKRINNTNEINKNLISHFENKFKNKTKKELIEMKDNQSKYTKEAMLVVEKMLNEN